MTYKNEQSGRSMIEMLGVLAIIGVLSVGGIAGYSKAMAKFKTNKVVDQVTTVVTNIRTLYSGQPNYKNLDTETAIRMGAIGPEMLNGDNQSSATAAYNAFNGSVTVSADNINQRSFIVTFNGLSNEACIALATSDWGSGSGAGLVQVAAGHTTTAPGKDGVVETTGGSTANAIAAGIANNAADPSVPLSVAEAAGSTGCSGKGDVNYVQWQYR